jgi:hypothetical protein
MAASSAWKIKKGQVETLLAEDGSIQTTFVRKAECPEGHAQVMRSTFETLPGVTSLDVRCVACDRLWPLVLSGLRR